jgi:Rps23 Pro-64 3,4-dihydroxylase Tpa1-like proline 4-hydroxylase
MNTASLPSPSRETFSYRGLESTILDELALSFHTAKPFSHLVIRNFLRRAPEELIGHYPSPEWPRWNRFDDAYQPNKMFYNDIDGIPPTFAALIHDLSSPGFLRFLEKVTGIDALLPDPYLEGGGLHCSGPGGVLSPHTDFHLYRRLRLYRRINVLLYLNPTWKEEWGGCLELYPKGSSIPAVTIVPEWGTFVIFKTDDDSVHGFSKPIVTDRWRRSIALYYYTTVEAPKFSGDTTTHWRTHGNLSGVARVRINLYDALIFCSRCFSHLAHLVNPHMETKLLP